ncbi:SAF domain-containing protein [Brevibacillus massiliensis]|jgi:hypothetical protein|uniref:SAF domain-containing protein n=1 Tax=Brevibacillus massiliensis TaxID=1118054 RepID=UPI00031E272C|nr:SAF domain-containing protein [Brevibacillus massiliensis]
MKKQTLLVIGIVSFILAGICFFAATKYVHVLAEEQLFTPIVKVAQGKKIEPFEPITRSDLVLEKVAASEVMPGSLQSIDSVVGKRSIQPIYPGEQIIEQKLLDGHLLPDQGKARYEFPLTWMIPITELRKGDFVKVWVRYKPSQELETLPPPTYFQKSNPAAELLFESQLVTVKDSNGIEIYTLKPQILPNATEMDDAFFNRTKTGQFVDGERRYHDYRAQPSSVPAYIGLNLTDQQYLCLTEAMHYGALQIGHILLKEGE